MPDAMKTLGGLIARGILQGAAGALAAKGVISPTEVAPFVEIGASVLLSTLGYIWSWSQKKRSGTV